MNCRICGSAALEPVIDLGMQPWCNHFLTRAEVGTEPRYPLCVVLCASCATAQLDYTVPKETMFADHTYLSGVTRSLSEHFQQIAHEVDSRFFHNATRKTVMDIGSNDGTQLSHFKALGFEVLGIESSKTPAAIARANGIDTVNDFFNQDLAIRLNRRFDVINAAGVFFHLEELHSVTQGIKSSLATNGIFVIQFLYMKSIMDNLAFDQIYHEHLLYYNLQTIERLLERHGLGIFDAYVAPIHGGSVIAFATHAEAKVRRSERLDRLLTEEHESGSNTKEAYLRFASRIVESKSRNLDFFEAARSAGKTVYGFGAPAKGNTLLNYYGLGPKHMPCLVEKNPLRRGLYSPGMHIPIVLENDVVIQPNIYYVLAWNFRHEILRNNENLLRDGVQFHFPVQTAQG